MPGLLGIVFARSCAWHCRQLLRSLARWIADCSRKGHTVHAVGAGFHVVRLVAAVRVVHPSGALLCVSGFAYLSRQRTQNGHSQTPPRTTLKVGRIVLVANLHLEQRLAWTCSDVVHVCRNHMVVFVSQGLLLCRGKLSTIAFCLTLGSRLWLLLVLLVGCWCRRKHIEFKFLATNLHKGRFSRSWPFSMQSRGPQHP
jgi:hypothetical protein